ncbi:MAG TPA: hypothetical protein VJ349_01145 [Stellaceae bacterium]|nr:hypothetical protein [Stellaceae bacterium]
MTSGHRWAFKARFRAHAYGWRGSSLASTRLKEAVREIKSVAKSDRVLAAEGCVSLMERLWPALEDIDTSTGALGGAIHRTLDELIPILISAPADVKMRRAGLERLYQAVMDDGVQYLSPAEDRWGEIAVYPEFMAEYAERLRALIRRVWVDEPPGGHVIGTAICLSCLLEAGRYGDMIELLACARMKWWYWHRFGAEALVRQGAWDAAIAYADGCRTAQGYDDRQIDRYCEDVLIKCGRADDAYHRYGLKTATGPTYLAIFRDTVKRYPDRDRRQVLLDLIETRGEIGKWFAAAKDAGLLDVALLCARDQAAEPAILVRAARDFAAKEPKFAAQIGVIALGRVLDSSGHDLEVSLAQEAFPRLTDAASRIDARDWANQQLRALVAGPCDPSRKHVQSALAQCLARCTGKLAGD